MSQSGSDGGSRVLPEWRRIEWTIRCNKLGIGGGESWTIMSEVSEAACAGDGRSDGAQQQVMSRESPTQK